MYREGTLLTRQELKQHYKLDDFVRNFPFKEMRQAQLAVLKQVCDAINAGTNYIIIEAPTGTGKSAMAIAIMKALDNGFIMTATKDLQEQYCLGPETRLLTADLRWVPASAITEGMELAGFDEYRNPNRRNWKNAKVLAVETVRLPSYRLTLEDGTEFLASKDHKWLLHHDDCGEWITTDRLRAGKNVGSMLLKVIDTWNEIHTEESGYLAAALDGDCLSQIPSKDTKQSHNPSSILKGKNEMLAEVERCLKTLGIRYYAYTHSHLGLVNIHISPRTEMIKLLGIVRPRRLLPKFDLDKLGMMSILKPVKVLKKEYVGEQTLVAIKTSTNTFIAEGFASHNCNDFPYLNVMKGAGNFKCLEADMEYRRDATCDKGLCKIDEDEEKEKDSKKPGGKSSEYKCPLKPAMKDYHELLGDNGVRFVEKEGTVMDDTCLYYDQKYKGLKGSWSVINYKYFFNLLFLSRDIEPRNCIILDEAHRLEDELRDFVGEAISLSFLRYLIPSFAFPAEYDGEKCALKWVGLMEAISKDLHLLVDAITLAGLQGDKVKLYDRLAATLDQTRFFTGKAKTDLETRLTDAIVTPSKMFFLISYMRLADQLAEKLDKLVENIRTKPDNWIVQITPNTDPELKAGGQIGKVEFKPLDVSYHASQVLLSGKKVILMSATILDKEVFCESIGVPWKDAAFIQVPSDFPVERRPVYMQNLARITAKNIEDSLPVLAQEIDRIMTIHNRHKGIIHTTSYYQLRQITSRLSPENNARLIWTDPKLNRGDVIRRHVNSREPTVLISPSLHTGLDLKDDLARFQVILKVPYPSLEDEWTRAKLKMNPRWYNWQTALRLVQTTGRIVRTREDYGITYCLDAKAPEFVKRFRKILPPWFLDALKDKIDYDTIARQIMRLEAR